MTSVITVLKLLAALVAAVLVGNWFLDEVRRARLAGNPWYAPYTSIPGILIFLILFLLPVLLWLLKKSG